MLSLIVPPSIGINTLYSYKKLRKFCIMSFFIGVYIPFVYLTKSSLTQYYSIVSLYLLSLQCAMRYNKNPFRSCYSAFAKLIMLVFYISRLISFLYFFGQVNAIMADMCRYIWRVLRQLFDAFWTLTQDLRFSNTSDLKYLTKSL